MTHLGTACLAQLQPSEMPNNRKMQGKKNNKKSRGGGQRVQTFGLSLLSPPKRVVKLPYAERIVLTESVASAGIHSTFSLNSLFDPNSGGVGVQPLGFDQMSAMYGQYRVLSCLVKCTFQNVSTGNNPVVCSIYGTYQPAVPANPDAWVCQPFGASASIEPVGGRSSCTLSRNFDVAAVLGLRKSQYLNDMDFIGTPAGNPTRQAYLVVGQRSMFSVASSVGVYAQLEYTVEFSQPLALNMS